MEWQQPPATDTSILNDTLEDEMIAEVIKDKAPPQKEKVQYFSQVTKYGFKNLFAQYNYNPALSYASQVNPHAEGYMRDYLAAHTKSLTSMKSWGRP